MEVVVNPLFVIFWADKVPTVAIPVILILLDQATPPFAPDPFEVKNWPADP